MDQFCPNCKYFMGAELKSTCPKCGYSISRDVPPPEEGLLKDFQEAADRKYSENGDTGPVYKCPICGNGLKHFVADMLSFELLGKEVTVQNVQAFRMNISKKAVTQVVLEFDSWQCHKDHKFYTNLKETVKELCPVCKGSMVKFGSSVYSCKSCNINLTKESFAYMSAEELLQDEGYQKHSGHFVSDSPA